MPKYTHTIMPRLELAESRYTEAVYLIQRHNCMCVLWHNYYVKVHIYNYANPGTGWKQVHKGCCTCCTVIQLYMLHSDPAVQSCFTVIQLYNHVSQWSSSTIMFHSDPAVHVAQWSSCTCCTVIQLYMLHSDPAVHVAMIQLYMLHSNPAVHVAMIQLYMLHSDPAVHVAQWSSCTCCTVIQHTIHWASTLPSLLPCS